MSLNTSKLERVCIRGDKTTAQCPACAESGRDQKGEHLVINSDGRFGCVVYPGDSADAKEHRKRIFAFCGDRELKPLAVHSAGLGRLGRVNQTASGVEPLKTGLLGRLGRVFQTHAREATHTKNNDQTAGKSARVCKKGVPGVPSVVANDVSGDPDVLSGLLRASIETSDHQGNEAPPDPAAAFSRLRESEIAPLLKQAADLGLKLDSEGPDTLTVQPASRCTPELADKLRLYKSHLLVLLGLNWFMAYSQTLKDTIFFCDDEDTRNVLVEAGAAQCCVYTRSELRVLLEHHREAPLSVSELLRIHSARRLFNGRIAK